MQETGECADEQAIRTIVAGEQVLVNYGLPALDSHFLLEENEVVMVVFLISKVLFKFCWVRQGLDFLSMEWNRRTLVCSVVVVVSLQLVGIGSQGVGCEDVVYYVILSEVSVCVRA